MDASQSCGEDSEDSVHALTDRSYRHVSTRSLGTQTKRGNARDQRVVGYRFPPSSTHPPRFVNTLHDV